MDADDFEKLRESLGRLRLNDASFHYEPETSAALGFGFRCGFLGLLHLEIVQERLTREFDLDLIATAPSVVYRVHRTNGTMEELHNPADMPDGSVIDHIEEPWIRATIMVPDDYLGAVLTLCNERRGQQADLTYVGNRAMAVYRLPLNEVVFDFYDRLKSVSRGYASFDYAMDGYEEGELVRISILVNQDPVDALSFIAHRSQAENRGRAICARLKDLIPRQLFKIAIQAAIGGRVIARETIGALSKDVTAKCYGGDITPQAQAAGKAEGRQEAHAPVRQGGDPPIRLPGRAQDGRLIGRLPIWISGNGRINGPPPLERWPSGLRRTLGKRVYVNSVPWVRIPLSPPPLAAASIQERRQAVSGLSAVGRGGSADPSPSTRPCRRHRSRPPARPCRPGSPGACRHSGPGAPPAS